MVKYTEKTLKANEDAEYQKDINKILVNRIQDTEKPSETLEPTMAIEKISTRKYKKREGTVIDNFFLIGIIYSMKNSAKL